MSDPTADLKHHFSHIPDPRIERGQEHHLLDILLIALCGAIAGANSWVDIAEFGRSQQAWLQTFLDLPNGIPSHDTFGRVFARLDPQAFQAAFRTWIEAVQTVTDGQVVAVDGKLARRSYDTHHGHAARRLISAWATHNRLVLGQRRVEADSNEIEAVPHLLKLLALKGCIVTLDAMGCQTEIAQTIVDQEADYVLAVKDNQPTLAADLTDLFARRHTPAWASWQTDYDRAVDKGHGRIEVREVWTVSDPEWLAYLNVASRWPKLGCVALVRCERRIGDTRTTTHHYFISSLDGTAQTLGQAVRQHWGIENSLHWVLDVSFREDDCRVRVGHAPENLAVLRHLALSLLERETSAKRGINGKRLKAAWDTAYLFKVLTS
jgi:predicted transposase YbfD/YdcC